MKLETRSGITTLVNGMQVSSLTLILILFMSEKVEAATSCLNLNTLSQEIKINKGGYLLKRLVHLHCMLDMQERVVVEDGGKVEVHGHSYIAQNEQDGSLSLYSEEVKTIQGYQL